MMELTYILSIMDESAYTDKAISELFPISYSTIKSWRLGRSMPRQSTIEKLEEAIEIMKKEKKIKYHPSHGYATEEQIEKLKTLGMSPDRDLILKQIAEQTKNKGKLR